jgi:outer membrane protein assembly factor BamD
MRSLIRLWVVLGLCGAIGGAAACGKKQVIPQGVTQPDRYLFDRANAELKDKNWTNARTYFQQIVDNYPQSPLRPDAKLGVGDTYLGENTVESVVLAAAEYKDFLAFYPTHPRADYAQYKLAMSHFSKMRAPQRDQSETREALKEFDVFFERYPGSTLIPEVKQKWREARDRLTESEYLVGVHYFKRKWWPGAIARFRQVLKEDPEFTLRDGVYYYLAESIIERGARTDKEKEAEALPYFERLLTEFKESEFLEPARKRVEELKAQ